MDPSYPFHMARRSLLGLGAAALVAEWARAQGAYPTRSPTIVVPYGAGSTNDILARLLAADLGTKLGQAVVVDNRPGAGGTLGIGQVVRGQADGYTLALVSTSSIPINRALYRSLAFDPARDLTLISITNSTPNALIVSADNPARSIGDLVAMSKKPGVPPLRYFSPGNGTSQHLSCVQFQKLVGVGMEHIPYRGPGEAITGLLAGETAFGFASVPSVVGLVRDGRLRALGTTGPRTSALPGVPTLASEGYGDFADTDVWYGVAAPKGLSDSLRTTLREALQSIVAAPALRDRLSVAGFDPVPPMNAAESEAFVARQVTFWADLVRQSGATLD
jgi:tripartite-type tricarboxylate transporter receptor subunit TctC